MGKTARKRKAKPVIPQGEAIVSPTPEQMAKGNVRDCYIVRVEDWTTAKAHRVSSVLDSWFAQGHPGFEEPARSAIEWCQYRWEARGVIGRQCANYTPTVGTGGSVLRDVELRDELDEVRAWFPAKYWDVFENVCRWGQPAGVAGSDHANNNPQAIASARAIVGLIANMIACRKGM